MGTIEKRTLEKERERLQQAIEAEKNAIARGDSSLDTTSDPDPDQRMSRREHLLELQSKLYAVESSLAAVELIA
jgi:hypothetical protein